MSPDITLILIQTENFCASLHARRDAGRVINKFVLMRKYFCIMSLMVTGCHHVSMPPHNCSHTNNSPTITRLSKPQKKYWAACLQRRERSVPGAGPGPLGRPRLRERAQVRRRHRHGEWVRLTDEYAMLDCVEWRVQYSEKAATQWYVLD